MNDLELNKALAELIWINVKCHNGVVVVISDRDINAMYTTFDFNNWGDLMPLVTEHKINSHWMTDGKLNANKGVFHGIHKNPQRARAVCLLKVLSHKEAEG